MKREWNGTTIALKYYMGVGLVMFTDFCNFVNNFRKGWRGCC